MTPLRWCAGALAAAVLPLHGGEDGFEDLVERVRALDAVTTLIAREHADPPAADALWAGAQRGIAAALDRHSAYLGADEVAIQGLLGAGASWGFGFDWRLGEQTAEAVVTRVVPGSPAAGTMQAGDVIVAVSGKELQQLGRRQAAEALARSGDGAVLRIRRGDTTSDINLHRAEIHDDGIAQAEWLDEPARIAHIRIGRFIGLSGDADESATCTGLRQALARLPEARALVLDLRGCAGGNLQAAVECAAAWAPDGALIVEQTSRNPARQRPWSLRVPRLPMLPLAVIVDQATASAAEVLAHALRHHLRTPVIGEPTQGKGGVQQLFLLPHGDGLLLTIARLRSPAGAWLDDGLVPDVAVATKDALPRALDVVRALAVAR
jgi:carboxyl-terminal processing protease